MNAYVSYDGGQDDEEKECNGTGARSDAQQETHARTEEGDRAEGSKEAVGGQGLIYVLKTTNGRLAKIGYTTNLEKRLKQLQTQASVMLLTDLEVVTTFPGTHELEKLLHRQFGRFRHRGDWYESRVLKPLMALPWPPSVELLSPAKGCSGKPPRGSRVTHAQYIHLTKIACLGGAARTRKLTAEQRKAAAVKSWITRRENELKIRESWKA